MLEKPLQSLNDLVACRLLKGDNTDSRMMRELLANRMKKVTIRSQ